MPKLPLRTQQNCLNCGANVTERFCSRCSQENTEAHHNLKELTREMVKEIITIDSKFLTTLKKIFIKPGYVPKEFSSGKRKSFISPVKMFFIMGGIFVFLLNYLTNIDYLIAGVLNLHGNDVGNIEEHKKQITPIYSFIFTNISYIIILTLPVLCIVLRFLLSSKSKKYYFSDLFVFKVCNYAAYLFIVTFPLALFYYVLAPNYEGISIPLVTVILLLFYSYTFVATKNYFGYGVIKTFFIAWSQIILWVIVFVLLLGITIFSYYGITGNLGKLGF